MTTIISWTIIGIFNLLFQNFKEKDGNKKGLAYSNYFMLGYTISLISTVQHKLWYLFVALILASLATMWTVSILKRYEWIQEKEHYNFTWIFLGFAIISIPKMVFYCVLLAIATGLWWAIKTKFYKFNNYIMYYPAVIVSFIAGVAIML